MEMDSNQDEQEGSVEGRGQYYKYQKDNLQEAVEKIRNEQLSYGEASRIYGVPKTTLYNKIQNTHNRRRGATTTLTKAQEDELAEWILKHQEYGDPRTKQDIINAACEIAKLDSDSTNHFKNGLPTAGWVEGFLKRYPHIVFRKPESISKAAAVNTKEDFSKLWRNIYDYLEKTNQLDLLHKPEHWWNADETSFPMDPIPRRVLARKGCKNVHRRERGAPKSNTTFTYAFSAAGDYIEPLITLKDSASNIADIAFACGSVGANFAINQTDSGWAQEDSFYHYVSTHLHKQWELKGSPKPRILIIDGYRAHLSVRLLRWGKLHDCIIVVLYPNGTPYLQMCDTTMFKPMKEKHIELYQQWRLNNPIGNSDDVVLVKLVKMVNDAVIREESIINGWRSTGLQPFNFNNLKCDDLLCKSPDYVYDFKGHHIGTKLAEHSGSSADSTVVMDPEIRNSSFDLSMEHETFDLSVDKHHTNVNNGELQMVSALSINNHRTSINNGRTSSAQSTNDDDNNYHSNRSINVLDNCQPITIFSEYGNEFSTLHELELPVMHVQGMEQSTIGYIGNQSVEQNEVIDCVNLDFDELTTDSTHSNNKEIEPKNSASANFTELSCPDKIFRSNIETTFDMSDFGISDPLLSQNSQTKLSKLAQKIRRDVKELAIMCAATDKTKLINILIINQQLNAIDPPQVFLEKPPEVSNENRTIQSILVPPTMPQRVAPKTRRNIKVGYGVATAEEVLEHLAEREILDGQLEIEQEVNEIEKKAREKKIDDVEKQFQDTRNLLMTMRSENASNVKEAAKQKKSKKRGSVGNKSLLDDIVLKNKTEIEAKNEELKVLREQLKKLKADHISANKAAAAKRKNDIQKKKDRGNVIIPQQARNSPN